MDDPQQSYLNQRRNLFDFIFANFVDKMLMPAKTAKRWQLTRYILYIVNGVI